MELGAIFFTALAEDFSSVRHFALCNRGFWELKWSHWLSLWK